MNERIRELAEQAGMKLPFGGFPNYDEFDFEKFAESIIRKCADICKKQSLHYAEHNNSGSASAAADCCYRLIKIHFGDEK